MIPVKVLAVRFLPNASRSLLERLGTDCHSLALLTTDCDDCLFIHI